MNPVSGAGCLEISVVIRVLAICLEQIVIHILHGEIRMDRIEPQSFELQHSHSARGILKEGLVYLNADLFSDNKVPFNQVVFYNLLSQVLCHTFFPS
jgi:hypothetical protein